MPQAGALQLSAAAVGLTETLLAQLEEPKWPHLRARCHSGRQYRRAASLLQLRESKHEKRQKCYLAHLRYILCFIMQLFDHSVKPGCDLTVVSNCYYQSSSINRTTSVVALSDWTSQILSNCSTRAPGSTNHCMICTSLMPKTTKQQYNPEKEHNLTFADIRE